MGGDHARKLWDLTDAIRDRDPAKAMKCMDRLLREPGSAEFALVAPITRRVREMIAVKKMTDARMTVGQMAKKLGRPEFPVKLLCSAVRNLSSADLIANYQLLLQADIDLKTLPSRERSWVIERLVLRLCGMTG